MSINVGYDTYASMKGLKYAYISDDMDVSNERIKVRVQIFVRE